MCNAAFHLFRERLLIEKYGGGDFGQCNRRWTGMNADEWKKGWLVSKDLFSDLVAWLRRAMPHLAALPQPTCLRRQSRLLMRHAAEPRDEILGIYPFPFGGYVR